MFYYLYLVQIFLGQLPWNFALNIKKITFTYELNFKRLEIL